MTATHRRRAADLLLAAAFAGLGAEALRALLGVGVPGGPVDDAAVVAVLLLPVLAVLLRAIESGEARPGWLAIGLGLALNSAGEAYFFFAERTLRDFPTLGDVLCLGLFPPLIVGIVLLARGGRRGWRLSIGSDAVIIALAIGALAYELIFDHLLRNPAVPHIVGGELAYPILDLVVLALLVVICLPSRLRVGPAWFWLAAGTAILLVTDVASLKGTAGAQMSPDILLYFGWGLAIIVLAASSRLGVSLARSDVLRGRFLVVSLGGAMVLALALLLRESAHEHNPVVIAGSATALSLGLVRLFRSLSENALLIAERDRVIARQLQAQAELRHLAEHDPLTGLRNRRGFAERVEEQARYSRRYRRSGALLSIDLDSFKFVNDSFGHAVGDRVLRRVGAAITAHLRESDTGARLGGDEFAILLPEIEETGAMRVAERLLSTIHESGDPIVGASAGIVCFGGEETPAGDDLMVAADIALYDAKAAGPGAIRVYRGQKGLRLTWVEQIREALRQDRLRLDAQPIVDVRTGEIVREELLIRMVDRDGREIPPTSFLPTADRFGLMGDIDRFALDRAIDLARAGRAVAVNISGPSLSDQGLLDRVAEAVAAGMDPRFLGFELTETSGVADIGVARRFALRLEGLGCELALDDFGTGLCSLGYLRGLPVQTLKIDTAFVAGTRDSDLDRYLVQTIVGLAHRLGQKTVAEGVEDEETLATVRALGVDFVQGFLTGRPAPVSWGTESGVVGPTAADAPTSRDRLGGDDRPAPVDERTVGELPVDLAARR